MAAIFMAGSILLIYAPFLHIGSIPSWIKPKKSAHAQLLFEICAVGVDINRIVE